VDLSVVILAEKVWLQSQFLNVVLRTQKAVVFVSFLSHEESDPLEGFSVSPKRQF
jgi:hypothetical protein